MNVSANSFGEDEGDAAADGDKLGVCDGATVSLVTVAEAAVGTGSE